MNTYARGYTFIGRYLKTKKTVIWGNISWSEVAEMGRQMYTS